MLVGINIQLKQDERILVGKHLLKNIMQKWINAADVILEMMVIHLPSPVRAQ